MKYDEHPPADLKNILNYAIWLNPYIKCSMPMILVKPDQMNPNNLKVLNLGLAGYFIGKP